MANSRYDSWTGHGRRPAPSYDGDPDPLDRPGLDVVLAHTSVALVSCAQWRWREGDRVAPRTLPTSNMALYHAGRGRVVVDGTTYRVAAGWLVCTPRGHLQATEHDHGAPFSASAIHAQLPVFGGPRDLFAVLGFPAALQLDPQRDAPVFAAFDAAAQLDARRPPGWQQRADAQLTLLLHHLLATHGSAFIRSDQLPVDRELARLAPVLELVEAQLPFGGPSLDALATALGVGRESLRLCFRRLTGLSPSRYIQSRRVDRACLLLRTTEMPVAQIATRVGVEDPVVLHRLFKRWTGQTPIGYRRGDRR